MVLNGVKKRILVVEDDTHLLAGIRDILELEHYSVLTAKNGQDGLAVLNADPENPPDVIVSDIMMPHMDGFQFLEEVRKKNHWVTVPFIFLTARGEKEDKHRASLSGADKFLNKPFDAEDLLVEVRAMIGKSERIVRTYEEKMEKHKDKLMTIVNHELRTPLTLIVAYAEMLKEFNSTSIPEEEKSFLKGVYSGADRMRRLIENFITVVDINMGEAGRTINWRRRSVGEIGLLVEDAYRQVALPEQRPRNFVFEIPNNLPIVPLDVQYMTIVIRELLENAAKFSSANSTVRLTAQLDNDYLLLQVEDEGRGIPKSEYVNIWKAFYQINREQHEDQGAGSGLAIVAGIVELHGGRYDVDSVEGQGSVFSIWLPLQVAT